MKSLIIGITGCSGSHLAEALIKGGHKVYGTRRKDSPLKNIEGFADKVELIQFDLNDRSSILSALQKCKPDQIFFLAAASQFQNRETIFDTNVNGFISLCESLAEIKYPGRLLLTSSSAVYGVQGEIHHLTETDRLLPSGYYGLSKVLQEDIAGFYCRNMGLDIIIARPFNITGPREYPSYVCSKFTRQIVAIERGEQAPVINAGSLGSMRDFTDARDIVQGYALLAAKGITGEIYNLCSEKTSSIKNILDILISKSSENIKVSTGPAGKGCVQKNIQVGNNSKIFALTGWKPVIPLDRTLEDMLTYYRKTYKP